MEWVIFSLSSAQITIYLCLIGDLTIGFLGRQKRSLKAHEAGEMHRLMRLGRCIASEHQVRLASVPPL